MKKAIVIIPVRDEAESLVYLLPRIKEELAQIPRDVHLLLINDGSADGSEKVAEENGINCVNLPPRGKAQAVKRGLEIAVKNGFEQVVIFDGDEQHPPEVIPDVLRLLDSYPLVKGTRFDPGSEQIDTPLERKMLNSVTRGLIREFTGWPISDPQCGLVGMRGEVVRFFLNRLQFKEEWELESCVACSWRLFCHAFQGDANGKCPLREVPIPAIYSGLHGSKQVEKYGPAGGAERIARIGKHVHFIYQALSNQSENADLPMVRKERVGGSSGIY